MQDCIKKGAARNITLFMLLYFLVYMGDTQYGSYIPLYLDSLGYDSAKIGAILAIAPMVSMAFQPVWGIISDRARFKNMVLAVMLVGASITFALIPTTRRYLSMLLLFIILFNIFRSSTHGVTDAIALEYLDSVNGKYGPVRMCATIGYAVMSIITGALAAIRLENIFWLFAVPSIAAALLLLFALPKVKGHYRQGAKISVRSLLKQKELLMLVGIGLLFQSTSGFYYSFYSLYFTNDLGGSRALLGIIVSMSAFAELPFLIISDKLVNRFGVKNLMLTACFVGAVRWILTAVVASPYLQLGVQLLHGMNSIVFMFCMAVYINQNVPQELKASGQTFYAFIVGIGSKIIGSWLGGILCNYLPKSRGFFISGILLAATLCILIVTIRPWKKAQPAAQGEGDLK